MKFHSITFFIALIWFSITAYFSSGYLHPDEHYQIIEFAGLLDGSNSEKDLAWEYAAHIRPSIQPFLCYSIFEICNYFSITDPYTKTFILRLLTGLLALFVIHHFVNSTKKIIDKEYWRLYVILSYFLWFIPFICVRFSSETWSGVLFTLSLSFIIRDKNKLSHNVTIGALLGLSFLFRYQIAFAILGLILWLVIIKKTHFKKLITLITPAVIIVTFGFLLDCVFYKEITLTTWNYLKVNLLEGKAAEFGTSPWYYYFHSIIRYSLSPIGIIILASFIVSTIKNNKQLIVWVILPFILAHSLIGHKELRFIFPMVSLIPLLIVTACQNYRNTKWLNPSNTTVRFFVYILLIINATCLTIGSLKPVNQGWVKLTEEILKLNNKPYLNVYYSHNNNPFTLLGLETNFYDQPNLIFHKIDLTNTSKLKIKNDSTNTNVLVVKLKDLDNTDIQFFIKQMKMNEVCKTIPNYMFPFFKIYGKHTEETLILFSDK